MLRTAFYYVCLLAACMVSLVVAFDGVSAETSCQIPTSGPWPACATGSSEQSTCVIPQQGPWPACATGNGSEQSTTANNPNEGSCIIPERGPWPACAKSGAAASTPANNPPQTDWSDRSRVVIYEAYITPEFATPNQAPVLHWRTNADFVVVGWRTTDGYVFPCPNVLSTETKCRGTGSIALTGASGRAVSLGAHIAQGNDKYLTASRHFDVRCDAAAWFFTSETPAQCPTTVAQRYQMQHQLFEKGAIVTVNQGATTWGYILTYGNQGSTSGRWDALDIESGSAPRDSNPNAWPPQNREKPFNEIGLVWSKDGIRDELGWAVAPATAYDGYAQSLENGYAGAIFLSHTNGEQGFKLTYSLNSLTWTTFDLE